MYGSIRIFVDRTPDPVGPASILAIMDALSEQLQIRYDCISYMLPDPDSNRDIVDMTFRNNQSERERFLHTDITPLYSGCHGDQSAPVFFAFCEHNPSSLYKNLWIRLRFPHGCVPFEICADFDVKQQKNPLDFSTYRTILADITSMGYEINNSFCSFYPRRNLAATFDGGQIGSFLEASGKRNVEYSIRHRKHKCLDCIPYVYHFNSLKCSCIPDAVRMKIRSAAGANNVAEEAGNFMFSLSGSYRSMCSGLTQRLQKHKLVSILRDAGLLG